MRRTASDARCGSCGGIVANGSSNFGYGGLEPFSLNQLSVAINTEGFSNLSSQDRMDNPQPPESSNLVAETIRVTSVRPLASGIGSRTRWTKHRWPLSQRGVS
jgi:hypothetical protein